ncbi:kinase-like domain-containing protein [Rhizophagus diaphanus]|nr:kinase-like domain-containing protein [Rhizophagus diaphanus] [Rhizophagus sp. MUCL 43196]
MGVEKAINENYIKYYNYSEFTNIKEINGNGSAGKIYQANWKGADSPLVIKSSYKLTIKEIVNELKIQRPNILRFYGISRLENDQMNRFSLFIEYADNGSLHSYLKEKFNKLECIGVLLWQLTSGRRPFYDVDTQYDVCLAINIKNGKRENIIEDTPPEYSNLYKACWLNDPDKRPAIQQVVLSLKSIISKEHNECISAIICKKELPKEINSKPISIDNEFDDLVISDFVLKYDLDT